MSSGFRLHQISARQVDAVRRVTGFYAAFARVHETPKTPFEQKIVASSLWLEPIGAQRQHYTTRRADYTFYAACCGGRVLARERPVLFRDLPESFKVGQPLPQKMVRSSRRDDRTSQRDVPTKLKSGMSRPASRFVHDCELLAV
jgi:hypothetical protein